MVLRGSIQRFIINNNVVLIFNGLHTQRKTRFQTKPINHRVILELLVGKLNVNVTPLWYNSSDGFVIASDIHLLVTNYTIRILHINKFRLRRDASATNVEITNNKYVCYTAAGTVLIIKKRIQQRIWWKKLYQKFHLLSYTRRIFYKSINIISVFQ